MITTKRWVAGALMLAFTHGAVADEASEAQEVVTAATAVYKEFVADPDMGWFKSHVNQAKGMLIVPYYGKAGFIIGGAGGSGLLIGKGAKGWSDPAFYSMAEASFGLQIGAEGSKLIFLVMTDAGMRKMVDGKAKLGADMNVAVGPVGGGATVETADVYVFAKSKGAYGGVSATGGVIQVNAERNAAYYGKSVSPAAVVLEQSVKTDKAKALVAAVSGGM